MILDMESNITKQKLLQKASARGFQNFSIDNPHTWCEKMAWLQLNDDIDLRARCADKIRVHEYSMEKLGKDICVPIIRIYDSPDNVGIAELPDKFVLKCNHGWNMNIVVNDKAKANPNDCKQKLQQWLDTPFGDKSVEIHYLNIQRRCFSETHIGNPIDYKFWCFDGTPTYCTVNANIGSNGNTPYSINWYDMNWRIKNISRLDHPNNPNKLDRKPEHFEQMKEYASILSRDFHFVRVDFYEVDGTVYLGELTFTPATGFIKWTNPRIDRMFGDMIKL